MQRGALPSRQAAGTRCVRFVARSSSAQASSATGARATGARSLEALRTWLGSKGASVDKVVVSEDVATGRPVLVAAKDCTAGETILSVGDALWMSPEAVKKHPIGKEVAALEPWLQVALVLVAEKFGPWRSGSEWSAYAGALPESVGTPIFWTDAQLSQIQGTQLLESVLSYRAFFAGKFEELQQALFSRNPAAFPPTVFTAEHFLWAVATVRARMHTPLDRDVLALVPLADCVSHSRNANVAWGKGSLGLFGRNQSLLVEATRAVKKGEELKMDFGPEKLDNEVMLDYGVIDSANSRGGYSLSLSLSPSDRNIDDKLDIAELGGLSGSASFVLQPNRDPPADMMAYLRLSQLQGAETFLLESIFRQDAWGHMNAPVAEDNERMICRAMADGATEALAGYGTTLAADLELFRSGTVAKKSVEEAALMVRLGEKEALDSVVRFFEQREALMPTLEFYQERRLKGLGLMDDNGRTTYDGFFDKGIA